MNRMCMAHLGSPLPPKKGRRAGTKEGGESEKEEPADDGDDDVEDGEKLG